MKVRAILLRRHADHRRSAWSRSLPMRDASGRCLGLSAIAQAEAAAKEMKAFADAAPDKQPDAG